METRVYMVLVALALHIVSSRQWTASGEKKDIKVRKSTSGTSKQNQPGHDARRWAPRDLAQRKKPSGHLAPLRPDDMDNDGAVSIAVGPPPIRPKFDKSKARNKVYTGNNTTSSRTPSNAAIFVKDILTELGREFLSYQVSEDFVFGQYVGNSMKNLTSTIKIKMQHDILDLILRYQRINDVNKEDAKLKEEDKNESPKYAKFKNANETEEPWPDFSNLAKIVG